MSRPSNPFAKIAKRLASLRGKADKLNAEIAAVTSLVTAEERKLTGKKAPAKTKKVQSKKAPAKTKKTPAKKTKKSVATPATPKKKGRLAKK